MNKTEKLQKTDSVENANDQTKEYWLRILRIVLITLSILAMVAFWGTFAYSLVTGNVKLATTFGQIIGIMVGVAVPVMILQKLYRTITRS